jgi:cell wall-associated NlpC family hydrolase
MVFWRDQPVPYCSIVEKKSMKKTVLFASFLFLAFAAIGCSFLTVKHKTEESSISHAKRVDLTDSQAVKETLYLQYRQWKDTEYALGGRSKKSIDCSGFVYVTYLEKLGIDLPRTTELQSHIGKEVQRSELRAADLVFFKTGPKARHVGMYIEDDTFLHVSKKDGVTISTLRDYYWENTYWQARRVGD